MWQTSGGKYSGKKSGCLIPQAGSAYQVDEGEHGLHVSGVPADFADFEFFVLRDCFICREILLEVNRNICSISTKTPVRTNAWDRNDKGPCQKRSLKRVSLSGRARKTSYLSWLF
jgi:hypothetical protein